MFEYPYGSDFRVWPPIFIEGTLFIASFKKAFDQFSSSSHSASAETVAMWYSAGQGYGPGGIVSLTLVIVVILAPLGRI